MKDIEIAIEENVSTALAALIARAEDMRPAMEAISGYLLGRIEDRFASEAGPTGVPWKQSRRAKAAGGQTLTDRANLRRSMRNDFGADYAAAGPEAGGLASRYAEAHQTGYVGPVVVPFHTSRQTQQFGQKLPAPMEVLVSSHIRRMNLPARPYLGFTTIDGDEVVRIIVPFLAAPIGGITGGVGA